MSSFGRADLSNVKKGDEIKLRNGDLLKVDDVYNDHVSNDDEGIRVQTTHFIHDVHGVRLSREALNFNIDDVVEVIPNNFGRADLTNVKVDDRLKRRNGEICEVVSITSSFGSYPIRAGVYYDYNGVSNISSPNKANDLDIVEILPADNSIDYKDLLKRVLVGLPTVSLSADELNGVLKDDSLTSFAKSVLTQDDGIFKVPVSLLRNYL